VEGRALSFDTLKEVTQCLLEINQEVGKCINEHNKASMSTISASYEHIRASLMKWNAFLLLQAVMGLNSTVQSSSQAVAESILVIKGPQGRINQAVWGPLNKTIVSAGEDVVSTDGSHFLTGSQDKSAKLWDIKSLTLIKTYSTGSLVNVMAMSQLLNHLSYTDPSGVVIDHGSYVISGTEGDHTLIAAYDFIQDDVLLGSTEIEIMADIFKEVDNHI
ncbi:eukaryotic translation initiation factor 3 subunit I-like protein, partial [Tanacetum coccineum]